MSYLARTMFAMYRVPRIEWYWGYGTVGRLVLSEVGGGQFSNLFLWRGLSQIRENVFLVSGKTL